MMKTTHIHALLVIGLLFSAPVRADDALQQGRAEYQRQNYEEALVLLSRAYQRAPNAETARYLGLTHYHIPDYDLAAPPLKQALRHYPEDAEVLSALANISLTSGDSAAAESFIEAYSGAHPEANELHLLRGRLHAARGDYPAASESFSQAMRGTDVFAREAGVALVELHLAHAQYARARRAAERLARIAPDSLALLHARAMPLTNAAKRPVLNASLGYRYEYDSNVVLGPNNMPSIVGLKEQSDKRHVITADLRARYDFSPQWSAFAEGHVYQSKHADLSEYDETRVSAVASLGWEGGNFGARLPIEAEIIRVDSEQYSRSLTLAPNVYWKAPGGLIAQGFIMLSDQEYEERVAPIEERSGDVRGAGMLLIMPVLNEHGQIRLLVERLRHEANGDNWQRDETRLQARMTYRFTPAWRAGLGFELEREEFDNIHDVFITRRDDEGKTVFVEIIYVLDDKWQIRLIGSRGEHDSNIDVYGYERDVISLGISWKY